MRVDVASKTDPTRSSGETLTGAALAFGLVDARRGGHTNHAHTPCDDPVAGDGGMRTPQARSAT